MAAKTSGGLRLWYDGPADEWGQAMPVGNGRLGAMQFGKVARERILLNEDTVWTGGPYDQSRDGAHEALDEVRKLVFAEEYRKANYLFAEKMMGHVRSQMKYQPLGNLLLDFGEAGEGDEAKDYRRELDLDRAVASVRYRLGEVAYCRHVFASAPDQAIWTRVSADRAGSVSFVAELTGGQEDADCGDAEWQSSVEGNDLVLRGRAASHSGVEGKVRYECRVRLIAVGGRVEADGEKLVVRDADSVTLVAVAATNVVSYKDISADEAKLAGDYMAALEGRQWDAALVDHVADHQRLFRAAALELPATEASAKPTDQRLKDARKTDDPALAALMFQYWRYLLIACSRPGSQPANLQGIWNPQVRPSWGSKFTSNINLEMNYWPAEAANLGQCVEPLVCMVEGLADTGSRIAKAHYNARGWVFHQNSDLWLASGPMDGPAWGTWPTGGAWLCQHLWERYAYGGDVEYLKRVYPLMAGAAAFFLDTLVEHPDKGWLVTCPSSSPENFPACKGNESYFDEDLKHPMPGTTICAGPTMDMQVLRDLFSHCIAAAEVLGVDAELHARWADARDRLAPMQVGRKGNLQEWIEDWDDLEHHHRHLSHLYGAYPSDQVTLEETPELAAAVRVSLEQRGEYGTGFSMAWKAAIWARLHESERAHVSLMNLFAENTCPNGLSICFTTPQVEGAFGGCAAIAEMLLQSHRGTIRILPALPLAWADGSFSGLCARGGVEVDVAWHRRKAIKAALRASRDGQHRVAGPTGQRIEAVTCDGEPVGRVDDDGAVALTVEAGKTYEVTFVQDRIAIAISPKQKELFQAMLPVDEFKARRERLFDAIGPDAGAVLQGETFAAAHDLFRQNHAFHYCCGVEVPQAFLLLSSAKRRTVLFLPRRDDLPGRGAGMLAADEPALVAELTGVDDVQPVAALGDFLVNEKVLYVPHRPAVLPAGTRYMVNFVAKRRADDPWDSMPTRAANFVRLVRDRFPQIEIRDLSPLVDDLRKIKSPHELNLLRKAGRMSAWAVTEAMRATRPGLREYKLQAIDNLIFWANGAQGEGYRSIVPNGVNVWHAHYNLNNNVLLDGEMVLMDGAPDLGYYTSDIGRMWPVSGVFQQWQRELYRFIQTYHEVLLTKIRPGITAGDVLAEARAEMEVYLRENRLSAGIYRKSAERALDFKGHMSHTVGMAVHDACGYRDGPLCEGMVFSVDPQMWIPEERLYLRVEDTVAITATGMENLTGEAPRDADAVEAVMREDCSVQDALEKFDLETRYMRSAPWGESVPNASSSA